MGAFSFQPEAGKKFYLKCTSVNGLEKRFELPQPNTRVYALSVSSNDNNYHVDVRRSAQAPDIPCYLLVHCRGTVLYFSEWDSKQGALSLPDEELPAGVIQLVLFDGKMNPLSERLIFSKNNASTRVEFHTDKEVYEKRDKIVSTLSFPDSCSLPFGEGWGGASISIAITDDKDIAVDETTTILSSLLLSSELKGYIENPAYYLQDDDAMDLLMMTHGWRRYNVPEVAKGKFEKHQIPYQTYQNLSGKVTALTGNRPVSDSEILITTKGGGFGVTTTGRDGSFTIPELDFPDSTTFYIQALDNRGRDNVKLTVDRELFPALVYAPQTPPSQIPVTVAETSDETDVIAFMEKAEQRAKFDEDIWILQLGEVAITAQAPKKPEPRDQFWANKSSDFTLTRETIDEYKYSDVINYLEMVPGIRVIDVGTENGEYETPGSIHVYFTTTNASLLGILPPALILIDGVQYTEFTKSTLTVGEIESIDVFKGVGATAFGVRGANGVVSITTRKGGNIIPQIEKPNNLVYVPLGYQKPVAFYSPKYETLAAKQSRIPDYRTTIFWKPDVMISDDGEASFEFYTSDYSTTYSVVIEGITDDGRMVRQIEKIQVE